MQVASHISCEDSLLVTIHELTIDIFSELIFEFILTPKKFFPDTLHIVKGVATFKEVDFLLASAPPNTNIIPPPTL